MGDLRANITIVFESMGKKFETEMWINYWPEECCGVDKRVTGWLNDCWEKSVEEYRNTIRKSQNDQIEKEEKAELKRLKEKYE